MAKKISQFDELSTLTGEENVVVAVNGANRRVKLKNIKFLVTKASIGLDNVDNTSDLNKPISIATQSALNQKANLQHNHTIDQVTGLIEAIDNKSDIDHLHDISELSDSTQILDSKANVTDVNSALANKSTIGHGHSTSEIVGLDSAINGIVQLALVNVDLEQDVTVVNLEW